MLGLLPGLSPPPNFKFPARAQKGSGNAVMLLLFRRHATLKYKLILCFLVELFGTVMSIRTLKRHLKRLGLRRRAGYSSLQVVARCLMVSNISCLAIHIRFLLISFL